MLGPFPDKNLSMLHVAADPAFLYTDQGVTYTGTKYPLHMQEEPLPLLY